MSVAVAASWPRCWQPGRWPSSRSPADRASPAADAGGDARPDPGLRLELGRERGQPVDRRRAEQQGLQVVFTASGSAQGRKDFGYRTTDFAVTEIGFQGRDPSPARPTRSQGAAVRLPADRGRRHAFPYQVRVAGKLVRNLRLSGDTLTKIFTNQITNWDDPAITADNNGRVLPSSRSSRSCTPRAPASTAQFTRYLDKQYPEPVAAVRRARRGSPSTTRARATRSPQNGSDGVMNFIASAAANGAIGYDEYSYALGKNYPVAKIENTAGYFTLPTQYNVAVALTQAIINNDHELAELPAAEPRQRLHLQRPAHLPAVVVLVHDPADRRRTTRTRMTDGQAADARRLPLLLDLRGPEGDGPDRLLAAAGQPGAGRLRPDRQAEDGRPERRPHQARRVDLQQPDLRRRATRTRTTWPRSRRCRRPATRSATARA